MNTSTLRITVKNAARHTVRLAVLAAAFTGTAQAESPLTATTHHRAHAKQAHHKQPQRSVRQSCDRRNSWLQNLLADKQCVDRAMADDSEPVRPGERPVLYRGAVRLPLEAAAWVISPQAPPSGELAL